MKNLLLTSMIAVSMSFMSAAQEIGETTLELINSCQCKEIVMVSSKVEKSYSSAWLEGVVYEKGFITFSKGDTQHRWNANKITFIEKGNGYYRIYID